MPGRVEFTRAPVFSAPWRGSCGRSSAAASTPETCRRRSTRDRAVARLLGPLLYWRLATDGPVTRAVVSDVIEAFLASTGRQRGPVGRTPGQRR
jgi:hypothetical protein